MKPCIPFPLAALLVPLALALAPPALAWQVKKDGTTQMKILDNGNVGIGTPSPGAKLEVAGYVQITKADSHLKLAGASSNGVLQVSGNVLSLGNWDVVTRSIAVDLTNGNVGIGANPTSKLEVAGQVKITGGSPGAGKVLTSDANGLASWQAPSSGGGAGMIIGGWDSDTGAWGVAGGFPRTCRSGRKWPSGNNENIAFFICISQ